METEGQVEMEGDMQVEEKAEDREAPAEGDEAPEAPVELKPLEFTSTLNRITR